MKGIKIMKKSGIYKAAQYSTLRDERMPEYMKLEILRELMSAEDLELYREKKAEEEEATEDVQVG